MPLPPHIHQHYVTVFIMQTVPIAKQSEDTDTSLITRINRTHLKKLSDAPEDDVRVDVKQLHYAKGRSQNVDSRLIAYKPIATRL